MIVKKKICMLGSFAVGKTSLIKRYVDNIFSEKYQTTIGVKIDKKVVNIEDKTIDLILWDMAGKDGVAEIRTSYLRGMSGYLLVVDKTRSNTLDVALEIHEMVRETLGEVPFHVLINKCDLEGKWDIEEERIDGLQQRGMELLRTSAKTGMGVNEAFEKLALKMIK